MLVLLRFRALTLQPRVVRRGGQLAASTSWLLRCLTLGGYARSAHVDGDARYVYLHQRRFWVFVRTRIIRFQEIAHVCFAFSELPVAFDRTGRVHHTFEAFTVALQLNDGEERVPIATFYGSGAAGDLVTLMYDDSLLDLAGTQENDSRSFVAQVCALLGVGLAKPLVRVHDAQGRTWSCTRCTRPLPPRPRCLYCGGDTAPDGPA